MPESAWVTINALEQAVLAAAQGGLSGRWRQGRRWSLLHHAQVGGGAARDAARQVAREAVLAARVIVERIKVGAWREHVARRGAQAAARREI